MNRRNALFRWIGPLVGVIGLGVSLQAEPLATRPLAAQEHHARGRLREALQRLDLFLGQGPRETGANWRKYVAWDRLAGTVQGSLRPSATEIQQLGTPFFAGHRGLELAPFADVREALRGYFEVVQAADDPDFATKQPALATEFEQLLQGYLADPSSPAADQVGSQLARLERLGVAPHLVQQTRQQHVRPNFRALASSQFIASGLTQPVDDRQPIHDVILGTRIHGWGHTAGYTTARLEPSDTHARVRLILCGQTHSTSLGYNGPVVINSRGLTQVEGTKLICIDAQGLTAAPACAHCSTQTTICGITSQRKFARGIIEKAAWKRAGQQKGAAEAIASDHAETRVARNLDQRSQTFLGEANAKYETKFRQALARRRALPQQMHFSTTHEHLQVVALQALPDQLAASTAPPPLVMQSDVTLQFHDSFVTNLGESMLSGVKLTDQRLVELLQENEQPIPDELKPSDDSEPWSITFARQRPVTLKLDGNRIRIGIRGQKFTRGDQQLDRLMEISAVYDLQPSNDGVKLTRVGEVEVDFPDREGQRLGVGEVTFRTLMRTKFSALFKPEISGQGIRLPGRWQQRGKMRLHEIQSQDRWLALGWK